MAVTPVTSTTVRRASQVLASSFQKIASKGEATRQSYCRKIKVGDPNVPALTWVLWRAETVPAGASYIARGSRRCGAGDRRRVTPRVWSATTLFSRRFCECRARHEDRARRMFGPVLSILTYKTEAEAIRLANDSNSVSWPMSAHQSRTGQSRGAAVAGRTRAHQYAESRSAYAIRWLQRPATVRKAEFTD